MSYKSNMKDLRFEIRANAHTLEMLNELATSKNVDRTNYLTNMIIDEYSKLKEEHLSKLAKFENMKKFAIEFKQDSEESKFKKIIAVSIIMIYFCNRLQ